MVQPRKTCPYITERLLKRRKEIKQIISRVNKIYFKIYKWHTFSILKNCLTIPENSTEQTFVDIHWRDPNIFNTLAGTQICDF